MFKLLRIGLVVLLFAFNAYGQDSTSVEQDSVYITVDTEPEFPGGMAAMATFFIENFVYPTQEDIQSKIYLRFIVEKDGTLTNSEALKGLSAAYDAEAMRLISIMPNWTPGYVGGQPVRTLFTVPMYICWR
jgi:protein TonB